MLRKKGFHFVTLQEAQKDSAYLRNPDAALLYGGAIDGSATPQVSAVRRKTNEKAGRDLPVVCWHVPR
jgi:hypothetical protein